MTGPHLLHHSREKKKGKEKKKLFTYCYYCRYGYAHADARTLPYYTPTVVMHCGLLPPSPILLRLSLSPSHLHPAQCYTTCTYMRRRSGVENSAYRYTREIPHHQLHPSPTLAILGRSTDSAFGDHGHGEMGRLWLSPLRVSCNQLPESLGTAIIERDYVGTRATDAMTSVSQCRRAFLW
ncbi:hypothetical protein K431DRAFT_57780 [Polychaeton citri CBS 116435]|uniref:Uncharacterized protein n=1 Tax=Polychaeton citri CBS 116435 TaxID=1314669 RepID=A0A9P4Q9S8_9PEZI|nr:hypothetical protein K431DRAFT_57780 [Polychaeton citri CBS 116435]